MSEVELEREATEIVRENSVRWGWGPFDEIEGLAEGVLAIEAVKAGIVYGREHPTPSTR